jgi:hypothetical protein
MTRRPDIESARSDLLALDAQIVDGLVGWIDGAMVRFAERLHGAALASATYDDQGFLRASWIVRLPEGRIRNDTAERVAKGGA